MRPRYHTVMRRKLEARLKTRHEFLSMLHELLRPGLYVETGVHTGDSLRLATCAAIGIDPYPMLNRQQRPNEMVAAMESDVFFQDRPFPRKIDFGFIDGMHRFEFAWRDFLNMEYNSTPGGVIVFDDVLPYTKFMANRNMVPGDWTGDVWKTYYLLNEKRPDLKMQLVDTSPTGTLVVWNLDPTARDKMEWWRSPVWSGDEDPPDDILFRASAVQADDAIRMLEDWNGFRV